MKNTEIMRWKQSLTGLCHYMFLFCPFHEFQNQINNNHGKD